MIYVTENEVTKTSQVPLPLKQGKQSCFVFFVASTSSFQHTYQVYNILMVCVQAI